MQTEIKKTADGSSTLFVPELNEHYHSTHGAVRESMHVFIRMGLQAVSAGQCSLLEIGFGTGLNALLSLLDAGSSKTMVYHAIDNYPLPWEQVEALNYSEHLGLNPGQTEKFRSMHEEDWGSERKITDHFILTKEKVSLQEFVPEDEYDLVYFDAFAPDKQPELWTEDIFRKMNGAIKANAMLVTYSAKGEVRRSMERAGFRVERLPGPPGKREMLRAMKP